MKKIFLVGLLVTCFFASDAQKAKTSISAKITPMYGLNGVEWQIHMPLPHCGRYDEPAEKYETKYVEVKEYDGDSVVIVCEKKK